MCPIEVAGGRAVDRREPPAQFSLLLEPIMEGCRGSRAPSLKLDSGVGSSCQMELMVRGPVVSPGSLDALPNQEEMGVGQL